MHRLDGRNRRHAGVGAPSQKFLRGTGVGPARVRVADVGREEFEEANRRPWRVNGRGLRTLPSRTAPQPIAAPIGATAPPASGRGSACYPVPRRKGSGCWRNLVFRSNAVRRGQFRLWQDRRPNALGFGGIAPQHRRGGADRTAAVYRHSVRDQSRGAKPRPRRPRNCSTSLPLTAIAPSRTNPPPGRCPNRVMCGPRSLRAIARAFLAGGSWRLSLRFL